jgi:hypothetical protein
VVAVVSDTLQVAALQVAPPVKITTLSGCDIPGRIGGPS